MILMFQLKNSLSRLDVSKRLAGLAKIADDLTKLSPSSLFSASWQDNPDSDKIKTLEGWKSHLKAELQACLKNYEEVEQELYADGHFQHFSLIASSARRTYLNDPIGAVIEEQAISQKNDRILNFQKRLLRQWADEMKNEENKKTNQFKEKDHQEITKAVEGEVIFNPKKSILICDDAECEIPQYKNKRNLTYLYLLCRMVFCDRKLGIGEAISNDEVRDEAFGDVNDRIKERTVKDAVIAVNRLTKDQFGWNIFEYHQASVKRIR
jgi:hypothetical protein